MVNIEKYCVTCGRLFIANRPSYGYCEEHRFIYKLCRCGCGKKFKTRNWHKQEYIKYHHAGDMSNPSIVEGRRIQGLATRGIPRTFQGGGSKHQWSMCKGRKIFCNSSWEVGFLKACEYAWFVDYVNRFQGRILYRLNDGDHFYQPDFEVGYRIKKHGEWINKIAIVEIKNRYLLQQLSTKLKAKAAKEIFGNQYIIIPEKLNWSEDLKKYLWKDRNVISAWDDREGIQATQQRH